MQQCLIATTSQGRYFIVNYLHRNLAWNGARWIHHVRGTPTGPYPICNFDSGPATLAYIHRQKDLTIHPGTLEVTDL
jgi:hypothetical protein